MDLLDFARYAGALLVTLGLLGVGVVVLRRFGPQLGAAIPDPRQRRLSIVEARMIDTKRRLVVARFEGRDHLILIGATGEQLIASETVPPDPAPADAAAPAEAV